MPAVPDALFAFVDYQDPYSRWLLGDEERPGPVLTLLAGRKFDRVTLYHTPHTRENARQTQAAILEKHPGTEVEVAELPIGNPKNYGAIINQLLPRSMEAARKWDGRLWVCSSSGTAEMRAAWYILASTGAFPARLLNVDWPKAGSTEPVRVVEVPPGDTAWLMMDRRTGWLMRHGADNRAVLRAQEARFERMRLGHRPQLPPREVRGMTLSEVPEEPAEEALELQPGFDEALQETGIYIASAVMRRAAESAAVLAATGVPVLLLGETGTGKELFARLIHRLSARRQQPMITVNCAAIPKDLTESWLFGHEKGAFTGASASHTGSFQDADGGTLFLDEIGELRAEAQAKLLRAIQEGMITPVGGKDRKVDVRIIAATNRRLNLEIKAKRFREDLYFRLSVGEIVLPPLRERRSEIAHLALELLRRVNLTFARTPRRFSQGALARLERHDWPGNVRELSNVIQRSVLFSRRELIDEGDLLLKPASGGPDPLSHLPEPSTGFDLKEFLDQVRRQLYLRAIEKARGNHAEAARLLGVSRQAVSDFVAEQDSGA